MRKINIIDISEGNTILAGGPYGRIFLSRLIQTAEKNKNPEPLFLNFKGIDVATGSFLRASILGFRDYCRSAELNLVPVVANPNEEMIEEFSLILELKNDALVTCRLDENDHPYDARVIGELEDKQKVTLETVLIEREVNAVDLEKKYWDEEKIKATGWNNRLSSLVAKGILLEIKKGRQKFYRPILEVKYGN